MYYYFFFSNSRSLIVTKTLCLPYPIPHWTFWQQSSAKWYHHGVEKCGNRSCWSWDEFFFFFFPLPPLKGGGGGRCFPSPPCDLLPISLIAFWAPDETRPSALSWLWATFLFFTQYGELIINLKWNKNDHAGIIMLQLIFLFQVIFVFPLFQNH